MSLKTEIKDIEQILASLREERRELGKKTVALDKAILSTKEKRRELLEKQEQEKQTPELKSLHITDHALLRLAERKYLINIEELRQEILDTLKGAEALKNLKAMGFVVKDNRVVTFVNNS